MNTTRKKKQDTWLRTDLPMIEISRFIRLILNMSLVFTEGNMKGSIIFGSIILNYFQGLMMVKEPCLLLSKWYSSPWFLLSLSVSFRYSLQWLSQMTGCAALWALMLRFRSTRRFSMDLNSFILFITWIHYMKEDFTRNMNKGTWIG